MSQVSRSLDGLGFVFRRTLVAVAIVVASLAPLAATAPADAAAIAVAADATATTPETVTSDVLPAPQIDGVVWKQVISGNTVFVGGDFTTARPFGSAPGQNTVPRSHFLAYNLTTGALDAGIAPSFNAKINDMAVTPDKTKLVVVGNFTAVNGQTRNRVAVFDLPGMTLSTTVVPETNGMTTSVAASNSAIYFGGWFSAINNNARNRVGAVSTSDGSLLPFAPKVDDGQLNSLVVSPDGSQVVLAGNFSTVGGSSAASTGGGRGLFRANATTGAGLPLPISAQVYSYGDSAGFLKLAADSTSFYGTAWNYQGTGNTEGTFQASWNDGSLVTLEDCHGDSYDVAPVGDVVYVASHKHHCLNSGGFPEYQPRAYYHGTAWTKAAQGVNLKDTYNYASSPGTPRPGLLPWTPKWVVGSFTGQYQAAWSVTGNSDYVLWGGEFPGVNGVAQQGIARFAVSSIAPDKVGPRTQSNNAFTPSARSLAPGEVRISWPALLDPDDTTLTYQLFRDTGGDGDKIYQTTQDDDWQWNGRAMSFTDTTRPAGTSTRYAVRVLDADGNYTNSGWAYVTVGGTDQTDPYTKSVMADGATKLWRLDDGGTGVADLAGADDTTAGTGVTRGVAGAMTNSTDTASSFNGTSSGVAISTNLLPAPDTFSQEVWFKTTSSSGGKISGFGDNPAGDSSHYDRFLSLDSSGRLSFGVAPLGVKTSITSGTGLNDGAWHQAVATLGSAGMALYVDGKQVATRATTTAGEHIGGYWHVGGDATWSGSKYFSGSIDDFSVYPTALTASQVANHWSASGRGQVANVAPTAAFTSTSSNLAASFDASTSADADGTIASYAWTFGDGATGTGKTASRTYVAAGTYAVKLTVTDNKGATGTVTKNLTVTAPAGTLLASDDFGRTASNGWGTADKGGAWKIYGAASRASVSSGVGKLSVPVNYSEYARLESFTTTSAKVTHELSVDKGYQGSGAGMYVATVGRWVGTDRYGSFLTLAGNGSVRLSLMRNTSAIGATYLVPGLAISPNTRLKVSVQVSGTSPTTISAKVWKAGATEPTAWQLTTTDSYANLQKAGMTGVFVTTPSGMTNAPVAVSFDSFRVQ